jgi:3-hydroxyisobutyrate dehydrogenase
MMKAVMIGLGAMGAPMARNLAKAGLLLGVYNRTLAKAQSLAKELATRVFQTPEALAAVADVILICVSADQDVLELVSALALAIKPGSVVIDMSTVSCETAIKAAALLAEKQAYFLDAPVSGGVEGAKKGALSIMVGGDAAILQQIRPILRALSSLLVHMGGVGAGQATKAVNQIMAAGINQAVTEALAFSQLQGLPMEKVIDVISGGAAGNWFLQHRGLSMSQGSYKPGFKLALHYKDLKICQAMSASIGFSAALTNITVDDYQQLMQQGFGDEDISALFRLKAVRAAGQ